MKYAGALTVLALFFVFSGYVFGAPHDLVTGNQTSILDEQLDALLVKVLAVSAVLLLILLLVSYRNKNLMKQSDHLKIISTLRVASGTTILLLEVDSQRILINSKGELLCMLGDQADGMENSV